MDVDLYSHGCVWQVYCLVTYPRQEQGFCLALAEHVKDEVSVIDLSLSCQKRSFELPGQEMDEADPVTKHNDLIP